MDIAWCKEEQSAMHEGCSMREASYDPAYDADPDETWAAIQRINAWAYAHVMRERAANAG